MHVINDVNLQTVDVLFAFEDYYNNKQTVKAKLGDKKITDDQKVILGSFEGLLKKHMAWITVNNFQVIQSYSGKFWLSASYWFKIFLNNFFLFQLLFRIFALSTNGNGVWRCSLTCWDRVIVSPPKLGGARGGLKKRTVSHVQTTPRSALPLATEGT